jgi:hypothetical protein
MCASHDRRPTAWTVIVLGREDLVRSSAESLLICDRARPFGRVVIIVRDATDR